MTPTVAQFIQRFERFAPQWLAMKGDPVGMQLGSTQQSIHRVLVTLDVRPEVVEEAIAKQVDFIFAHHPAVFRPARNLVTDNPQNAMYAKLLANHIAVYAAHTNLDMAAGGMNDWLADQLQLRDVTLLQPQHFQTKFKLVIFVPTTHEEAVRQALTQAKIGQIGAYQGTSFGVNGTGYFTPEVTANPYLGQPGQAEAAAETRLEVILDQTQIDQALDLIHKVHPYEEPVYDLYPLARETGPAYGIGRIGRPHTEMTVQDYAHFVRQAFQIDGLRLVTQNPTELVKRVAVIGGDGGKFYPAVLAQGANVFVTGDVYYHTAHDMLASGLSVMDPGHHVEQIVKARLVPLFENWAQAEDWQGVQFIPSQLSTDPFSFVTD